MAREGVIGFAGWADQRWNFAPYKSREFMKQIKAMGHDLKSFGQTAMYALGVSKGLIENDEWTGSPIPIHNRGLVPGINFERQVNLWINRTMDSIFDRILDRQITKGGALTVLETAKVIKEYAAQIRKYGYLTNPISYIPADKAGLPKLRIVDPDKVYDLTMDYAGPFMHQVVERAKVPTVYIQASAKPTYRPDRNMLVINSTKPRITWLPHVLQHYLDTLPDIGRAAEYMRNQLAYEGTLIMLSDGEFALRGPWLDPYDGKVYKDPEWLLDAYDSRREFSNAEISRYFTSGKKQQPTEFVAMAAMRFREGRDLDLALMWERCPQQVAFFLCSMRGQFVRNTID